MHFKSAGAAKPAAPPKPPAPAIRLSPVKPIGSLLVEHGVKSSFGGGFRPLRPPKSYIFPNSDQAVKHLAKTTHFPWEGNKTGTPKLRGATKAHRESQVETSGYPAALAGAGDR